MRSASLYPFLLYTLSNGSSLFTIELFIDPYIASKASLNVIFDQSELFEIKKLEGYARIALTTSSYRAPHAKVKPFLLLLTIDINSSDENL